MSRQAGCGRAESRNRARMARMYLDVAELASEEHRDEARTVAAGNAVLAAIAASDALCCAQLGRRHRSQDHQGAVTLLRSVRPEGTALAKDLEAALSVKDPSHYGERFVTDTKLKIVMRAATRLVQAAESVVTTL